MYDIAIVGGGPAGLSCAIYAGRAGLSCVIIERAFIGGQMATTDVIENYPGIKSISGYDLAESMRESALSLGCEFIEGEVESVSDKGAIKEVICDGRAIEAKAVLLAMGAQRRKLGVDGEEQYTGSGVSYCATCDGNFFKDRDVMIVGGGNTALEEAMYLSNFAKSVTLVHRRDEFRAERHLVELLKANEKINVIYDSVLKQISGRFKVQNVVLENVKTNETTEMPIDGVFIAVGTVPQTDMVKDFVKLDKGGYIIANEMMETDIPGIFAAGDVRQKELRQVVTAASDGAIAANMIGRYINKTL